MKKMLYVSPFWPQKSGISDYSERLIWGLKEHYDITIFTKNANIDNLKIRKSFPILSNLTKINAKDYDEILYNFGNSPENHDYMCDMLEKYPGYIILHDFTLYYLMVDYYNKRGNLYSKIYKLEGKEKFLTLKDVIKRSKNYELLTHKELAADYPLNAEILKRAKGIFVHSHYTKNKVGAIVSKNRVHRINIVDCMPKVELDKTDYLRKRYGWDNDTFIIGAVGMIAPSKQNDATCIAVRRYNEIHEKKVKYVMIGEGDYVDNLLSDDIKKTGFLEQQDFFDAINSCDSVFNLRYPYNGESSASLMQCMLIGKPCVVTDIGWFGELLDDIVYKVSCENSIDEIVECIEWLMSHDDDLQQMAMKGRQYVEMYCNENAVAESIAGVIQ